jgi:GGDEF domain-containing protein
MIGVILLFGVVPCAIALATGFAWLGAPALALLAAGFVWTLSRLGRAERELDETRQALCRRAMELDTLHAVGREIVSTLLPRRIFAILERECRKIFDVDVCLIALVDGPSGSPFTAHGSRHRQRKGTAKDPSVAELTRWAVEEKRSRRVDDVTTLSARSPLRGAWLAPKTRSLLVVPLMVDNAVIGVLTLQSGRVAAYDDHQLNVLNTIAQQAAIAIENTRHYERATVDSLTGLYVRDHFFSRLEEEDERARRYGGGFALLMVDLDSFKEINDHNGHLAGDLYLREISATIRSQLRAADIRVIAERIRAAVSSRIVGADGLALRTTVSIGVAAFPDHGGGDLRELLRKADEALYRAKRAGRDRVVPFAA